MKEQVYAILKEIRPEFDFSNSDNFIEDGYLDSFDVVTVVDELEKTFGIIVDGIDVIPDNFISIDAICELINNSEKRS